MGIFGAPASSVANAACVGCICITPGITKYFFSQIAKNPVQQLYIILVVSD
jgi:hypothetical protein